MHHMKTKQPQEYLLVYMTTSTRAEAETIARVLVQERLAAGVNILTGAFSYYWWKGEMREGQEYCLVTQTMRVTFSALQARVCALHSYEVPCIVAVPLAAGHKAFLDWIAVETGQTE